MLTTAQIHVLIQRLKESGWSRQEIEIFLNQTNSDLATAQSQRAVYRALDCFTFY